MQKRPLHICIITAEFPALTETFITTKALELRKRGHKITVIKNEETGNVNASHLAIVRQAGIEILSFADVIDRKKILKTVISNTGTFIRSLSASGARVQRNFKKNLQLALLSKHDFDIIHFEFSGLALSYLPVLNQINSTIVVSCRGTAEKVKPVTEPGRAAKLSGLFDSVSGIHCVSHDMANTVRAYCKSPQKIFVNTPSVDVNVFKRTKAYEQHRPLRLLSIGRFTFQKGYLLGLLAIEKLKEKNIDFVWKIVGNGPQLEEMQYHAHALGIGDHVEFLGKKNRDEVIELYNSVDIFFLPSVYEGIANVCLEAMAMELPVVATRSGGMEEVIEHGLDGLLAATYDAGDMAEQLSSIADDFEKRANMGKNARQKIISRFMLEHQADVFEAQYYKLLQHSAKVNAQAI